MAKKEKTPAPDDKATEEKERVSFYLNSNTMLDVKFIALFQGKSITEMAETAFGDLVKKWVSENGSLPKRPKKA